MELEDPADQAFRFLLLILGQGNAGQADVRVRSRNRVQFNHPPQVFLRLRKLVEPVVAEPDLINDKRIVGSQA